MQTEKLNQDFEENHFYVVCKYPDHWLLTYTLDKSLQE